MSRGNSLCDLRCLALGGSAASAGDPDHWAFNPPQRPRVPRVNESSWIKGPIDSFILAQLEERGLRPSPEADRATLLRRLSFDLTGLPPTPVEIDAFLADRSPLAYERLVDRLLASPHYGERWGQHWLDLARYAETDGFEFDQARTNAWRYRDWVVQALNRDLPYDAFVRLQLAGDEARPGRCRGLHRHRLQSLLSRHGRLERPGPAAPERPQRHHRNHGVGVPGADDRLRAGATITSSTRSARPTSMRSRHSFRPRGSAMITR